jgi:indolepyruvate decarboxylase
VVAEVIRAPECAPAQIDEALTAAITWKRPVYLEVLENVWNQPCTEPAGALSPRPLPVDTGALEEAAAETVARVTTARKPVIWSGVEIARFGLQDELEQLIAASALPFATDLLGKATLSENHAGFVGVYDGAPAGKTLRDLVEQSDCVLALGTIVNDDALDLVDKDYARMILAVDNTLRIGYHLYAGIPLQAFLAGMRKQLQERSFASPASAADFAPVAYPETAGLPPNGQITFESFFERMKRFVDESMVLMADTCISLYCAADLRVAREKGWVSQSTWGSIGYTMGGALGVGCAEPDRRPVVWVGDGGFQMICQALSTMVREKQSPIVFVMNNGIYGIEQALVNLKFYTEGQPAARFNILPRWDYARLTEAFGGWGCTVETQEELEAALAWAKTNTNSPSLIEVRLPERDLPPQVKRLAEDPG